MIASKKELKSGNEITSSIYRTQKFFKPVWRNYQHRGLIFCALPASDLIKTIARIALNKKEPNRFYSKKKCIKKEH